MILSDGSNWKEKLDVNLVDCDGKSPLFLAIANDFPEIAKMLLTGDDRNWKAPLDVSSFIRTVEGPEYDKDSNCDPLEIATRNGYDELVDLMTAKLNATGNMIDPGVTI